MMDTLKRELTDEELQQRAYNDQIQYGRDISAFDIDEKREEAVIRKIDFHVIPFVVLLYLFSFLDRGMSCSNEIDRPSLTNP